MRDIVLLGSTGSIGTQAVDIVRRNPDRFRVVGVGGQGSNVSLLAAQALELQVEVVGVAKASAVQDLQLAFSAEAAKRGYATGEGTAVAGVPAPRRAHADAIAGLIESDGAIDTGGEETGPRTAASDIYMLPPRPVPASRPAAVTR